MGKRGFTLIELLMVIGLLSILSAVAVPYLFSGPSGVSVPAMAKKIKNDVYYAQSLAMRGYNLDTPTTVNPAFRFRIRFNTPDANCAGTNQYAIVSDVDNNGTWGENPNSSAVVESARNPVNGNPYFCVQLDPNTGDYSGFTVSANFGGTAPGVLEFDNMGIPYNSDGVKLSTAGTVVVSKGGTSSTVSVTKNTGMVTVQ
ncbi:MAG: type II secretion system protein [Deltaproteobacteria bacterium]|nr:type II secretion system protein [Deltaproteobacteria bacterium]